MASAVPDMLLEMEYTEYARDYLRRLPLEHFMEATLQGFQRAIVLACLALLRGVRPDVHIFNELLVQYERPRRRRPGQVVPDNMVVLHPEPLQVDLSYDVPLQPARPFWVMEWVSQRSKGKDYKDSFRKYERELKVPYCLMYHPDKQDLRVHRHTGKRYEPVPPNEDGRYPIPDLELEVGMLDGWVRFWFRGDLLPLPADLQRQVEAEKRRAERAERRAQREKQRADELERQRAEAVAEAEKLRALLEQMKGQQGEGGRSPKSKS